jgi:hypothetical protein
MAGSRNDPWYRELAQNVAESFFDHVRIRTVRSQIFYNLGEFENVDPSKDASAANQLERIWRYEQRVLAKRRKACALSAMQAPPPEFHYCCEKIVLNKLLAPNAVSVLGSFLVNFGRTNPMRYAGRYPRNSARMPTMRPAQLAADRISDQLAKSYLSQTSLVSKKSPNRTLTVLPRWALPIFSRLGGACRGRGLLGRSVPTFFTKPSNRMRPSASLETVFVWA